MRKLKQKPYNKVAAASKSMMDVSSETRKINKCNKEIETDVIPVNDMEVQTEEYKPFTTVRYKPNKISPVKSFEEVFETSNKFTSLDEDDFDNPMSVDGNEYSFDRDETIEKRALEGEPSGTKIVQERKSLNPDEYRVYDLDSGVQKNAPVLRRKSKRDLYTSI